MIQPADPVAMIFAHHPHEISVTGMLLRWQPDVLFLTCGHEGNEHTERVGEELNRIGFTGSVTFWPVTESQYYRQLLAGNETWFAELRDRLSQWLQARQPQYVLTDAFEGYNPIHDLASLLACSAIRHSWHSGSRPRLLEFPLAVNSLDNLNSGFRKMSDSWHPFELTPGEIRQKRVRCQLLCENTPIDPRVADHPRQVLDKWTDAQFSKEYFREVAADRCWTVPPPAGPWQSWDQHSKERVAEGRYQTALSFAEHFAPLAKSLLPGQSPVEVGRHAA